MQESSCRETCRPTSGSTRSRLWRARELTSALGRNNRHSMTSQMPPRQNLLVKCIVESYVWLDDELTKAKLSPYISDGGVLLWNVIGGEIGPHLNIHLFPLEFGEILAGNPGKSEIVVDLSGPSFGHIDEVLGYAAAACGNGRKLLEEVKVEIKRIDSGTRFIFSGRTDQAYMPLCSEEERQRRGRTTFKAMFVIDDQDLGVFINDRRMLDSMRQYVGAWAPTS